MWGMTEKADATKGQYSTFWRVFSAIAFLAIARVLWNADSPWLAGLAVLAAIYSVAVVAIKHGVHAARN